jgi:uncharacterized protein (TIGR00369 family)
MPILSVADIEMLLDKFYPPWRQFSRITTLGERDITLVMPFRKELTRAGGTISGPAMMALADTTAYYLVLAHCGPVADATTANLDIHFLSRPAPVDVTAVATLLRKGKRLVVSRVDMTTGADLVASATVTYSVPAGATTRATTTAAAR